MLPNEAVLISDGDRIDFELTESFGSGRIVFGAGAGAGAASEAGWQATVAAGAQAGEAAAQGLAGAHFGAQGLQVGAHFGAQELQAGAHFGAQGSQAGAHFGAQGSQQWQANRSANRPPKGRNSQQALRGSQVATGAHFGAQGLQALQAGAPHPQAGAVGAHFGAHGLQELQVGAPHPQGVSRQRAAVKTLRKLIMPFPGYHSSIIPQLTSQRVTGAQGLQQGAQVAGAQVAGAHVAGAAQGEQVAGAQAATGAGAAGAASTGATGAASTGAAESAGVGAAAGAQEEGAQAALAPQNPQLNFPQRFPTVQELQGSQVLHFGAPHPQAGATGAHFGAQGLQTGPHFGAQGLQELHAGDPQPHFGAQGSQQGEPNRQHKMPRFFPGYQSLLHTGFSYVQRGWNNGAKHGLAQELQPTLLQQQALAGLPQFEQAGS